MATLIAATLLARFPIGINALALILYLRHETGSFAVAGVVAGGLAAGAASARRSRAGSSTAFGQRRVLRAARVVHAAALGGVVALHRGSARRRGADRVLVPGRLRDPADLVGAALDVADAAARARRRCCSPPTRSTRC